MRSRLAIVLSHPIQYFSPFFKMLHERQQTVIKVFYTWGQAVDGRNFDHGFGKQIEWDIPLLEGYPYEFLQNVSAQPGSHHFKGIVNPDAIDRIKAFKPDAVMVFGWAFQSHLRILRYFKNRIPVLFRGDSTLLDKSSGLKSWARYWLLKWVYSHVDKALYVGKSNLDYYIRFGLKPHQLVWAPHAIDNKRFMHEDQALLNQVVTMKEQIGIKPDDFVFLFAGKFETKKDPVLLLKAFLEGGFNETVHLVFVGAGVLGPQLRALAVDTAAIHFLDFQNQQAMPAIYRMADVFILPSAGPGETWGLAVNEAMACKRPVIVSDKCGCARDLVENGLNGYVFKAGQQEELTRRMKAMVASGDEIWRMQEASLQKVGEYSIEKVCEVTEQEMALYGKS